ncbi:unnamed protein product [Sphacelaria rigidula]
MYATSTAARRGCSKRPSFGAAGGRTADFCAEHAPASMVNVRYKHCGEESCSKRPSFGASGGRKAEFCVAHAGVRNKHCDKEGRFQRASFGTAGGGKAQFCAAHAPAGMVDVRNKHCVKESCSKYPSFDAAVGRKAEFCASHASAGMVDLRNKHGGGEGCSQRPSFGAAAGGKAELCATHARPGVVNVQSKRRSNEGCSKYPSFGAARGRKAAFCATHACAGSMNGSENALQPSFTRVRKHGNASRHASHDLAMASDAAGRVQERNRLNDDPAGGKNSVGTDDHEGSSSPSDADPDTSKGSRSANSRRSPRAIRGKRRRGKVLTTSPAASGQFPVAAAAFEVPLGGAQTRMKVELEATITSREVSEGMGTSGELNTTLDSSCISMGNGGSSSTAVTRSCGSSIASKRNTKRLRKTLRVEPLFDVVAGDERMAEVGGADLKLEWDVSARSRQVSAAEYGTRDLA